MDILFENHYERTPEIHKQLLQYLHFKRAPFIIFAIIFSISFLVNLLALILWGDVYNIAVLIVVPLYFLLVFVRYRRTLKLSVKRDQEEFGHSPLEIRSIVYPHQFQYTSRKTLEPFTIPFTSIKKAFTTKDLIVLQSDAKLLYVFHKNGFAKGSEQEFISFLKLLGIKCR